MNPSLFGAVTATLFVVLWLVTRRRPRPFLRSDDTSAVAALNRAQLGLVERAPGRLEAAVAVSAGGAGPASAAGSPSPGSGSPGFVISGARSAQAPLPSPADARGRRRLLGQLGAALGGSQAERLEAMRLARRWRDPSVLPLLRRGLRDVHPAVVQEAALALEAYRGRSRARPAAVQAAAPPRNVARTR